MEPSNIKINEISNSSGVAAKEDSEKSKTKNKYKIDLTILGKIDLDEAEMIASEEVLFLTEDDLIEGLEEFELIPIKMNKDIFQIQTNEAIADLKPPLENDFDHQTETSIFGIEDILKSKDEIQPTSSINEVITNPDEDIKLKSIEIEESQNQITDSAEFNNDDRVAEEDLKNILFLESTDLTVIGTEIFEKTNEEIPLTKKIFTVKINEETLDNQLNSILDNDYSIKNDDKNLEKYYNLSISYKERFIDDQFLNKKTADDALTYNEDPLTERLVNMIEVADGRLELLEISTKSDVSSNYILEDYTLYNSEKFDTAFKEEIFYVDSDFEFIDNAIIRDDFTKYIHEIDDYFESEESLIHSEISEILGLIPDEYAVISDKLFGDYYKKYDLDNEIDFIKPEIDFFRSSYTGAKHLNYISENKLLDTEKNSIEEDISSPDAIVFEEDISEIVSILEKNFNFDLNEISNIYQDKYNFQIQEEIYNITDKIIILEDKESLIELTTEYPEKHENLVKLLSYLDGLFEKLPEEVIKKFAESEYFELYSKVLREIGV